MKHKNQPQILNIIQSSFKKFYSNWPWILLLIVVDLLFIFILAVVMTFIQVAALEDLTAMMKIGGTTTAGIANVASNPDQIFSGVQEMTSNQEFQQHMKRAINLLFAMIISGYILWVLFQGLAWWLVQRFTERKQSYLMYLKNFAGQSLIFYGGFVILLALWVKYFMSTQMTLVPWISANTLNITFWILAGIWWYYGFLSYTIGTNYAYRNTKEAFKFGTKKILYTAQTVIIIALIATILDIILRIPYLVAHQTVLMVIGIFLIMPVITYVRILLFETRKMYWPIIVPKKVKHKKK